MRLLLATAGSRGDVEPFIALGESAAAAGHRVRLVVPEALDVAAGVDIVSMGADFTRLIRSQGVSPARALRSFRSVVQPLMRRVIVEGARAALEYRPDLIVYHPKVLSAPLVADALGVPHVLVETVPVLTETAAFPAAGTITRSIRPLNRWTYRAGRAATAMFRSELAEAQALVGGSRRRPSEPIATLLPVSTAILPRPDDWPETVHMTGPWLRGRASEDVSADVAEFIEAGPFVYAGFGSMGAPGAAARGRVIIDSARDQGFRVLVATGLGGIEVPPDRAGGDVLVMQSVAHRTVLPLAAAAVHHGGIGTIHAATLAAAPSVIVPFIADQPFWGARLHAAGLAPAPIRSRALTVRTLRTALDALDDYRVRVTEAARIMSTENGTTEALRILDALR